MKRWTQRTWIKIIAVALSLSLIAAAVALVLSGTGVSWTGWAETVSRPFSRLAATVTGWAEQGAAYFQGVEALQAEKAALEKEVAEGLEGGLLVVDGPVRLLRKGPLLGYIKTHWVRYLPKEREALLEALAPGERTPAFRVHRKGLELASWYVRLPLPPEGLRPPLAGLLRVETPLAGPFLELADLSLGLFPALASHPVKDPRAPQNLLPVGGLERELSRRMGRPEVVGRMLARYLGGAR